MKALFRPMVPADLPEVLVLQEQGSVTALAAVFPQESHPFPRETVMARWREELDDPAVGAFVGLGAGERVTGFAVRREDELLHFGAAVETWGSGFATWLHDQLMVTYPPELVRLRLRVFEANLRARRFYEKLGWRSTGLRSRSSFAPHPVLVEYAFDRPAAG